MSRKKEVSQKIFEKVEQGFGLRKYNFLTTIKLRGKERKKGKRLRKKKSRRGVWGMRKQSAVASTGKGIITGKRKVEKKKEF